MTGWLVCYLFLGVLWVVSGALPSQAEVRVDRRRWYHWVIGVFMDIFLWPAALLKRLL